MKILALTRYQELGASSRLRFVQYFNSIGLWGVDIEHRALIIDDVLVGRYVSGRYQVRDLYSAYLARSIALCNVFKYDIVWIEKELFPWLPFWFEYFHLFRAKKIIIDYDDAVFHVYDKSPSIFLRWVFGKKIDKLMALSDVVVVGNNYLAERARKAGARSIKFLPTVIDIERYQLKNFLGVQSKKLPIVVWVGSPSTIKYLGHIRQALLKVFEIIPFTLRVVGAEFIDSQLIVEQHAWAAETESQLIQESDVGVMPLIDSEWERGKCGYKLIQYMACGLPVIASPVGVNAEIVTPGFNGFLAQNDEEWVGALLNLLDNKVLAMNLGANGRLRVEEKYCLQVTAPQLIKFLE